MYVRIPQGFIVVTDHNGDNSEDVYTRFYLDICFFNSWQKTF